MFNYTYGYYVKTRRDLVNHSWILSSCS